MEVLEKVENVANILNVSPSTLKKYYLLFEEEGYRFKRSHEGHVLFEKRDIELLKKMMILKNEPGITLKKAVQQIVKDEGINVSEITNSTTSTMDVEVINNQVSTLMKELEELKILMKEQNNLLQKQEKYIDEKLKERDLKLVAAIRQSQEEKREMLEKIETLIEEQRKDKKTFWSRLFGK